MGAQQKCLRLRRSSCEHKCCAIQSNDVMNMNWSGGLLILICMLVTLGYVQNNARPKAQQNKQKAQKAQKCAKVCILWHWSRYQYVDALFGCDISSMYEKSDDVMFRCVNTSEALWWGLNESAWQRCLSAASVTGAEWSEDLHKYRGRCRMSL